MRFTQRDILRDELTSGKVSNIKIIFLILCQHGIVEKALLRLLMYELVLVSMFEQQLFLRFYASRQFAPNIKLEWLFNHESGASRAHKHDDFHAADWFPID